MSGNRIRCAASSLTASIHSSHAVHDGLPTLVATKNCLFPLRSTPGIRLYRDGLRFCRSVASPFFSQTW